MLDDFGDAAGAGGDGDHFAGHAFQGSEAEGFQFTGHQHDVRDGQFFADLILLAEKQHMFVNAFLYCQPFRLGTVGAVANQQEFGRNLFADAVEDFDYIEHALYRAEV